MSNANKLRVDLLPSTLKNAIGLAFYQELWRDVPLEAIQKLSDLPRLPTVDKAKYRASFMFDRQSLASTALITHTTGTTGELTWRHRTSNEAAVIQQLFGLANRPKDDAGSQSAPLALVVQYGRHGMGMPVPGTARCFPIALSDDVELDQALAALNASFHFGDGDLRPTILAGGVHHLALLAQAWLERGGPKETSSIKVLQVLGYTEPGLYAFLMDVFDGPDLFENFSMTELLGSAIRGWPSRAFVLDPHVIGEVIDEDGLPVEVGDVGELTLTELFPFVQSQPLIRYRTGDIAKLVSNDDQQGMRFEPWNRRQTCISRDACGRQKWVLGFTPIADWISQNPMCARGAVQPHLSVSNPNLGTPCCALSWNAYAREIDLAIGVAFNPWLHAEAARSFVNDLTSMLQTSAPGLRSGPAIRLSLHGVPNAVKDFPSYRIENPGRECVLQL
jgi:hypothetical protein